MDKNKKQAYTTIRITTELAELLHTQKKRKQTYNDLIKELIK